MTKEQVKKWIDEVSVYYSERDWKCSECGGVGSDYSNATFNTDDGWKGIKDCVCHGTGTDLDKNIGEMLMDIVVELSGALEAYNNGKIADWDLAGLTPYKPDHIAFTSNFSTFIRNTFEDRLAHACIKLFGLCGYLVDELNHDVVIKRVISLRRIIVVENIGDWLFDFDGFYLHEIRKANRSMVVPAGLIGEAIAEIKSFSAGHNIPIDKHIEARLAYMKGEKK